MFSIGKIYDIEMLDGFDNEGKPIINVYPNRTVTDVELPLIKISANGQEEIINTHSPIFVRSKLKR